MKINIMTFNTQHFNNYLTNEINYDEVVKLINKYKPDIIGLNEVYGKGFDKRITSSQAEEIANKIGYFYYFGKSTSLNFKAYGNAILSKYPIIDARVIKIPNKFFRNGNKYYEKRSIINAKINVNNHILNTYVTHFGLNDDEQRNAVDTIISNININDSFIIMGDFNTFPENKILNDLWDISCDTAIKLQKDKYTWPADNPKVKYDYILTSKNIKTLSSKIPDDIVSDHLPVISKIEF